ncbi:MAG: dipeptidase, partial [Bacteroidales bacterium]|nr:dipeptidase [Bacteroidales bacterium]
MRKKVLLTTLVFFFTAYHAFACTNFLIGKKASNDGSTLISYAADSFSLYGELYHWPARTYKP